MKTKIISRFTAICKETLLVICGVFFFSHAAFASESAVSLYTKGLDMQSKGDWYGAAEYFREALDTNPSYGDAWFHLAQCVYEAGDYELAVSYTADAEKYSKNNTPVLNLRGMAFIALGHLEDARKIFENVLLSLPNDVDARFGLAELDLFDGKLSSAEKIYQDALKRQGTNRKALLSLALVSSELGKTDIASLYIEQALRYHSGDSGVHYLAAYLAAKKGDMANAEYHARMSSQIKPGDEKTYSLLASILYAEKQYADVIDMCDYLININKKNASAWYIKGLARYRQGENALAIEAWKRGIEEVPYDEIMRSALELLSEDVLPTEDPTRKALALYHEKKASDYRRQYLKSCVLYEYQRALKIDPMNISVRSDYAEMLRSDGMNEMYLKELKFIQSNGGKADGANTKITDAIEAYTSLLSNTLAKKWNIKSENIEKTRWKLGIYYIDSPVNLLHCDSEWITAGMASQMFTGISHATVNVKSSPVSGFGEAYRDARESGRDYFIIMSLSETSREIAIDADMYSARTGTNTGSFSIFRTGNDRYTNALRRLRQDILEILPIRGEILDRKGDDNLLIDLGRADGIVNDCVFDVVRKGAMKSADSGPGVSYDKKDILGVFTVLTAGEELSEGKFVRNGFFDRLNVGDEVVVVSMPAAQVNNDLTAPQQTSPAADVSGKPVITPSNNGEADLSIEALGLKRTPILVDLIRNIY